MRLGEDRVLLTVASLAGVGSEDRDIAMMAVVTGEWYIRSCHLMTSQRESHHFMREQSTVHLCERCIRSTVIRVAVAAT